MTEERRQRVVRKVREILSEAEREPERRTEESARPLILIDGGLNRIPKNQHAETVRVQELPAKSPLWREKRIAAIRLRCKELGIEEWRHRTLRERYHISSITKLSDADLDAFSKMVMKMKLGSRYC